MSDDRKFKAYEDGSISLTENPEFGSLGHDSNNDIILTTDPNKILYFDFLGGKNLGDATDWLVNTDDATHGNIPITQCKLKKYEPDLESCTDDNYDGTDLSIGTSSPWTIKASRYNPDGFSAEVCVWCKTDFHEMSTPL